MTIAARERVRGERSARRQCEGSVCVGLVGMALWRRARCRMRRKRERERKDKARNWAWEEGMSCHSRAIFSFVKIAIIVVPTI